MTELAAAVKAALAQMQADHQPSSTAPPAPASRPRSAPGSAEERAAVATSLNDMRVAQGLAPISTPGPAPLAPEAAAVLDDMYSATQARRPKGH